MKHIVLISVILLTLTAQGNAAIGWKYLTIPNGAREIGMGETGVSHSSSGTAVWWNPAHLGTGETDVWFQGFRWIADGRGSFGGVRVKTSWGGLGAYYFNHGMDGFEIRDRPGPSQGEFKLHQAVIAGGASVRLKNQVNLGLIYKASLEDIYGSTYYTANILDVGAHWRIKNWSLGAALNNVSVAHNEEDELPIAMRFGASRQLTIDRFDVVLAAEADFENGGNRFLHVGAEAGWRRSLFLRLGYMSGHDSRNLTFGLGAAVKRYHVDFALTPMENDLGTTWRMGIGLDI